MIEARIKRVHTPRVPAAGVSDIGLNFVLYTIPLPRYRPIPLPSDLNS